MASSFSTLGIELIATGEASGLWGDKTNVNLQMFQEITSGYVAKSIAGSSQTTALSITNATVGSDARQAIIELTGTITGNQIVTVPDSLEKVYIVKNATSGSHTVQFKTASGTGVTFAATEKTSKLVFADGTNIVDTGFAAGVAADDISEGDAAVTIATSSGDITIDSPADIVLDADGADVLFKDGGTTIATLSNSSSDFVITTGVQDKDFIVKGDDGGAAITALTLDMSAAGAASFNSTVTANAGVIVDNITIDGTEIDLSSGDLTLDAAGDIVLDADGADVFLKDAGTTYGSLTNSSGNLIIKSGTTTAATFSGANVTLAGTVGSGAITSTGTVQGTTITATTAFVPDASDGAALGTSSLEFSDLFLADAAVINLGDDQDVTITHVADTGILLNAASVIQFRDSGLTIGSNADGDLDIVSDGTAVDSINVESAGGITLDAGTAGSGIIYEDDGTEMMRIHNSSSDVIIESKVSDKDIIIKGNDGGSTVSALTLDMSAAGAASFNAGVTANAGIETKNGATGAGFVKFFEDSDNGTNAITLQGPASTSDVTFTLPSADGSNNHVLKTDGSGNLSFAAQSVSSIAADDISTGDAAVTISTSSGNITIDAAANDTDIIFKGTDNTADITMLTLDGSDAGTATFNHDIILGNDSFIQFGGASETISGDGTDMTIAANNLTVDAAADIILDAAGNNVTFKSGGTSILDISNSSSDAVITSSVQDKDIIFKGDDGGAAVTALTLDMSAGGTSIFGAAAFNAEATLTDASTISWDVAASPVAKVTLGANRTLGAGSNAVAGQFVSLLVIQDGTGSRTLSFNAVYEFTADTAPTLTTTASKGDLFVFRYNGSKFLEVGRNLNLTLS
ncbi:MAG: hypothetical protein CMI74_08965 [Candidatus Pelagibacter sp.]|nr:hypothetical protein [Candidatus Pelagibacter sp.]